jgi:hypothetical protein
MAIKILNRNPFFHFDDHIKSILNVGGCSMMLPTVFLLSLKVMCVFRRIE